MELATRSTSLIQALSGQFRTVYFARARWFPWRQKIAHRWQRQATHDRHLLPPHIDRRMRPIMTTKPRLDPSDQGALYHYQVKEVPLSLRRLHEYVRLLKNRNLQDAIDWVACLSRPSARPILQMLKRAKYELVDRRGLDLGRLAIDHSHSDRGEYVKIVRRMRVGHYSMFRSPRHHFRVYIREVPMEEYFHRMYILGKVPQCVSFDMRQALRDQRVAPETERLWAPYLTSNSRYRHRLELRRLKSIGQFDYYKERKRWISEYQNNMYRLKDAESISRNGGPSSLEHISG
jgi:ribosomal protein L22